jgi:SAM-dependent methyltransferase
MADLNPTPRFDRVARLYRAMEYLSFGPMLERCRFAHIPALTSARRALVLGDGDGRFLARLLTANFELYADAVDASPAMMHLLRSRVERAGAGQRVRTVCGDARHFVPEGSPYDLVVTHFFLDCLSSSDSRELVARIRPQLTHDAMWVVSEFQIPTGNRVGAALSSVIISCLYAAFRVLTGLSVRRIPPWRMQLAEAGFRCAAARCWLGGLLVSELWQLSRTTAFSSEASHQAVLPVNQFDLSRSPGIDPGPIPDPPTVPEPRPAPGPPPEPDPIPYPGPLPTPQPVTRA